MLDIDSALNEIRTRVQRPDANHSSQVELPVADSLDRVVAQPVVGRTDVPPHDKAMMDGYAIRCEDWAVDKPLTVVGRLTAGQSPAHSLDANSAMQIMTGAPIPPGADSVVMFEQCTELAAIGEKFDRAADALPKFVISGQRPKPGQNIMRRGNVLRDSEEIVSTGSRLTAASLGLIVDSGNDRVAVYRRPTVAVLATGDELVTAGEQLRPGAIHNSNGPMIGAMARQSGAEVFDLGIGRDDRDTLAELIQQGMQHDVLLLTGGVSAGVLDLVPGLLQDAGVEQVFHKVQLKPGKPVWFGHRNQAVRSTLVFGLPGNPVSALVCFHVFVRPALDALSGARGEGQQAGTGKLAEAFEHRGNRPTYWPATSRWIGDELIVQPLPWRGSSDLRTMAAADSLAIFPAGDRTFAEGEPIQFIEFGPG